MDPVILRIALESGSFQLFDEQASLQTNAHRKQAATWLKGTRFKCLTSKENSGSVNFPAGMMLVP